MTLIMFSSATSPAHQADKSPGGSPGQTPPMPAQSVMPFMPRRTRPGNVQTNLIPSSQQMAFPPSAISTISSISTYSAVSSSQASPIMTPEVMPGLTTSSSIQASPEPIRGRDMDQVPSTFHLPESVLARSHLSHKTSTGSLAQPLVGSANSIVNGSANGTGTGTGTTGAATGTGNGNGNGNGNGAMYEALNGKGLLRRLSTKASSTIRGKGRRQSSAHGSSRGVSVGPGLARPRQRSNSDLTNPFTDSDDEPLIDIEDKFSLLHAGLESTSSACQEPSPTSAPASVNASVNGSAGPLSVVAGPVVPLELRQGTKVFKMTKRGNRKPITLVLDSDNIKITWDKNRTSKCIYIDNIKEIRTEEDIRQYRLDFGIPDSEEPLFFSILHAVPEKSKTKMTHLIAEDPKIMRSWVDTLYAISLFRQEKMISLMAFNDKAIRTYWKHELVAQLGRSESGEEDIDFTGLERVCHNLHIHVSSGKLRAAFRDADSTGSGRLNFSEFQVFVREMKKRADITAIYREVASDTERGITLEDFTRFLAETQKESVEAEGANWDAVFTRFSRRAAKETSSAASTISSGSGTGHDDVPRMSEAALASFLTSTYNVPIVSEPKDYVLDRPMNEYFISSSHNTYLLGRQVVGMSSVEGYISALTRGCRCVEIDCWDGGDGQPVVSHGWTLTTAISFEQVINVINKYAFKASEFPLWISLEVHCSPEQQRRMAAIMREIFGAKLVTEPLHPGAEGLPSPSELKNRILIKAKKPQADEPKSGGEAGTTRRRGNSLSSPYSKPMVLDNAAVPTQSLSHSLPHSPLLTPTHPTMRRIGTKSRVNTITEGRVHDPPSSSPSDCDSGSDQGQGGQGGQGPSRGQSKITKELGELAVYCAGIKFQGFDSAECKTYNHILSFHEGTFDRNSRPGEAKRALFRHNMRYLMRVYPHRNRLYSSNFDPLFAWRRGVQMAALNWQTFDLGMQINQAMFDGGTGRSGYVLKPKEFRAIQHFPWNSERQDESTYPLADGKRQRKRVCFSIDVISAQQLMRPHNFKDRQTVDPYVEVEAFLADDKRDKNRQGADAGPSLAKFRTRIMDKNGFNPVFDAKFNFNFNTKYPELVFVRWTIRLSEGGSYSDRNTILATFTAKLSSLKQGYRTLPLLDANGDRYLFSTLFCRITVDPITDVYVNYPEDGVEDVNKLRGISRSVFSRSTISPKSSVDSGTGTWASAGTS